MLFAMFAKFQTSYYNKDSEPVLDKKSFINHIPIIIIDCSKQNESLKSAPVDVRLEIDARENFSANISEYCLIFHDRMIEYNSISGDVKKL